MTDVTYECPASFNCPTYRTDVYTKCENGFYCGASSRYPTECPPGYFGSNDFNNVDIDTGCLECGQGKYSELGTNGCKDCLAGYICDKGAKKANPTNLEIDGGYVCPAGFYCPSGSITPIACPAGSYSEKEGIGSLAECKVCPKNYFGIDLAAITCYKCRGGTVSDAGSTTCRCEGLNRKYLAERGTCVCKTGFEPVHGANDLDDGLADCDTIVYSECDTDEVRDTNGQCRKKDDCAVECDGG